MGEPAQIRWRIAGEEFASCNCNWGCPCQFNALPTTGRCEAFVTCLITDGYFANTRLDGVVFSRIYWWPRAIHEGNGVRRVIIDEQTTKEQRDALMAIESGQHCGLIWEISAAVALVRWRRSLPRLASKSIVTSDELPFGSPILPRPTSSQSKTQ